MIWWIEQPVRAQAERAAIGELAGRVPWLTNISWRVGTDLQLVADFDLVICDRTIALTLLYPAFFPDAALLVISRDGVRLSGHQYGAEGELCLEYRPDNWSTDVTGSMMIESAHYLLSSERETGAPAPSAHRTVPAQHVRGERFRFLLTPNACAALSAVGQGQAVEAEAMEHAFAGCYAAQLSRIGPAAAPPWSEPDPRGGGACPIRTWIVKPAGDPPSAIGSIDTLLAFLESGGFHDVIADLRHDAAEKFVLLIDGDVSRPVLVFGPSDAFRTIRYKVVLMEPSKSRVGPEYERLNDSKVAIVGCGSVGAKVAVQLARAGFRKFVLVDGDMLHSGNLVRNELDWRAVGLHKAPSLAARLKEVRAGCEVIPHSIVMGGQESAGTLSVAIASIESCDIIIEATADAKVFNLCAAISRRSRKPMCWGYVFGGGAGGVVVRLRPGLDPTPLTARKRVDAFYSDQGMAWSDDGTGDPYGTSGDGPPLIADDADVSVIAAHLARLVIDLAARPGATIFPHSAYVIGLRQAWLFSGPFDTFPVNLGGSDVWGTEPEEGAKEALQQLTSDLSPRGTQDED